MKPATNKLSRLAQAALIFFAIAVALLLPNDARAKLPAIELEVGFDNVCKVGHWTPVRVRIMAGDKEVRGRLELSTTDGDGIDCLYAHQQNQKISVPAGKALELIQYVRIGTTHGPLEARVINGKAESAAGQVRIGTDVKSLFSTQRWILVVGQSLDLQTLLQQHRLSSQQAVQVTQVSDMRQLPDAWFGFEGIDTILLTTGQAELAEQLSAAQLDALEQWTRMGGRLLISMGENGPKLAGEGGPLRRFAPCSIQEIQRATEAPGIESFARADQRLAEFTMSELNQPIGQIVTYVEGRTEGQRAAIVRYGYSFGMIHFLAFDLDSEPLKSWSGRDAILSGLLFQQASDAAVLEQKETRSFQNIGYEEMSGQLRAALDHFPSTKNRSGVTVVTFWTIFPLLLFYIALLGPGDFFLLQRLIRRMEWTWITFPLLIVLTSAAIYVLGSYWRGGSGVRVNQVDIVDIDPGEGIIRGTTFAQLYSPSSASFEIDAKPTPAVRADADEEGILLAWQGLPGQGLGGFDTTRSVEILPTAPYRIVGDVTPAEASTKLEQLLLPTAASKGFLGRWWRKQQLAPPDALRVDHNEILHGTVTNPLSVSLSDAMVVHDQWVYRLERTLNPDDSIDLDTLTRRDLEWRLTRRHVHQSSTSYSSTPWDPESRDVTRIMELMMFHEAAGGQDYTGLSTHYQGFIDLTDQLRSGRAILVGRSTEPAAELRRRDASLTESAEQKWTWYRIVLPVQHEARSIVQDEDDLSEGALH